MPSQSKYQAHLERRAAAGKELYHSLKAKEDARRTFAEDLADWLTEIFGTLTFLIINVVLFTVWIILNIDLIPGLEPFDPFPFGFLTMAVSLEAIVLAIVVLISQNRASKIGDLRQEVDLQINVKTEAEITKLLELVTKLLEKHQVDLSADELLPEMLQPTNLEEIEEELEEEVIGDHPAI